VKAILGILLSGIVGGIAWELGPTLGVAIWSLLPIMPLAQVRSEESYGMAALFFVWQPMIALFIGRATSEKRRSVPIQSREGQLEVGASAPQTGGGLGRRAFLVLLAGLVILSLTRIVPVRLRQAHRERVAAKKREKRPASVDLPVVQPMSEDEALILKQVGDYQPVHALKRGEIVSHEQGFERPGN